MMPLCLLFRGFGQSRNQRAAILEHGPGSDLRVASHEVEHYVDILRDVFEALMPVVDHVVGTERADEFETGPRSSDKGSSALCLGKLHRQMADSASARMNQHALTLCESTVVEQTLPGGQCSERYRCRY